jgi:hypothetical protein
METNFNPLDNLAKDLGIEIFDSPPTPESQEITSDVSTDLNTDDSSLTSGADDSGQYQDQGGSQDTGDNQSYSDDSNVYYNQGSFDNQDDEPTEEETLSFIDSFLQERYGSGLEDILSQQSNNADIDERLLPILQFVNDTGRSPEDWFRYQMLNPTEMDDLSAVRMQISTEYPELSTQEINDLIESKYKIGEDFFDEKEQKLAQLQLKIDANKARREIDGLRSGYLARTETGNAGEYEVESIVDDNWLQEMSSEVDALEGIDFEISAGKTFTFGLNDSYKNNLKSKNAQLDSFFDQYVEQNGQWNHELFSMHRTVVDNIDEIVKAVYSQGLSDGQRKIVQNVANIDSSQPNVGPGGQRNSLLEQIENIMGQNDSMVRFKL